MKKYKDIQEARKDYKERINRKHKRFRRCSNCKYEGEYSCEYTKCMVKDKLCFRIEAWWCRYYTKE